MNVNLVVLLCTLNEESSLPQVLSGLARSLPGARVIVVDDDSEDRTADVAAAAGADVIVRKSVPRGRGLSGRDGYLKALGMNPDVILEMDADGSHDPADAPKLVAALDSADIAVGSRDPAGGGADDRGWFRKMVSRFAKMFLRSTLGIPLRDPTSGYRAFRADALKKIDPATLTAVGPEIVEEIYIRAARRGLEMSEVPIVFKNRTAGESKLTLGKTLQVALACLHMR